MSCVKRRKTHVFIILTSRSFRTNSPSALSSQCPRPNLWESWQSNIFGFCEEKSAFLSSRLAAFTFAWIFSPLGEPRFRLSAFESTFTWKWDTVLKDTNLPSNGHENAAFCVLLPAVGARSNGGRARYIIESKVQWKPFWLATLQYPQNSHLVGRQFSVYYDVCARPKFLLFSKTAQCYET